MKGRTRHEESCKNIHRSCDHRFAQLPGAGDSFATRYKRRCARSSPDGCDSYVSSDSSPIVAESRVVERYGTRGGWEGGIERDIRSHARACANISRDALSLVRFYVPFLSLPAVDLSTYPSRFLSFRSPQPSPPCQASNANVYVCACSSLFDTFASLLLSSSLLWACSSFEMCVYVCVCLLACLLARVHGEVVPPVRRALLPSLRPSLPLRVPRVRAPAERSAAVFNLVISWCFICRVNLLDVCWLVVI